MKHDLVLFAYKDPNLKIIFNEFILTLLKENKYLEIANKFGHILNETANQNKGLPVADLIKVYSKVFQNVKSEGFDVLSKSMANIFMSPKVESSLRQHRADISLQEILQVARLDEEIHKKILVHPICMDFFISFVRSELKHASMANVKFEPPKVLWDVLLKLIEKWPNFFKRFGNSLSNFEDLNYVRIFNQAIQKSEQIFQSSLYESIFDLIIKITEKRESNFPKSFETKDYIKVLYESVLMSIPNDIRSTHHLEVIRVQESLTPPFNLKILMMFDKIDLHKMITQQKNVEEENHVNIYLKLNRKYLEQAELLKLLQVETYDLVPMNILVYFEKLPTDENEYKANLETIIQKSAEFDLNVSQSVISAEKTLPVVNKIKECLIKCAESISVPYSLEKLVLTKEMAVTLNRKNNLKKDTSSSKTVIE